jgi:hypothetical protein
MVKKKKRRRELMGDAPLRLRRPAERRLGTGRPPRGRWCALM